MLGSAGAYLAAALLLTWPLALHPFSQLGSTQGPGDSYLNVWILGWDLRTLFLHPGWILSGRVFDANIFFPATGTLTYSDHLLLQAIAISPLYATSHNLALCYNVLLVASLVCCAMAMHAYARELTDGPAAAWVAGFAWGFAPYHFSHLIHFQLQSLYFLPLTFLFLHRLARSGRWQDASLLGLMVAGQALSSVYYGVIGGVGLLIAAVFYLIDAGRGRRLGLFRQLAAAALLSASIAAPVGLKYWIVQQREGFGRSLHEAAQGSAVVRSYLEVPPTNLFYGHTGLLASHASADTERHPTEQNLFPGFMLAACALCGLAAWRIPEKRAPACALCAVAAAGFILSLGPDVARWLYASLYDRVFGFQAIRAPARFSVLVLFGLAGLAALGVDALARRRAIAVVVLALVAIEYVNAPIGYAAAPAPANDADMWLAQTNETGAVAYLPLNLSPADNTTFMLRSLTHGRPIVNGYSGQRPASFTAIVDAVSSFPSAEAIRTLLDLHVRFVVAQTPVSAGTLPVLERARFADGVIYEVRSSPELDSMLMLPETPPLPQPVNVPFGPGDRSIYTVTWTSGPMALPAGRIELDVRAGTDGARLQLLARGTTADWVSPFFRADDRFVSAVDDRLRSVTFEQHLSEGRRQVERRARFDRAGRRVRVQQGGGAELSLPIAADTLDPLALFFFSRTLTLTPGASFAMPMNDSNRNFVVTVRVDGPETITVGGRQMAAIRTSPRIERGGGFSPLQMTVWFEPDGQKRAIRADIGSLAGVGSVRLELESGS